MVHCVSTWRFCRPIAGAADIEKDSDTVWSSGKLLNWLLGIAMLACPPAGGAMALYHISK